MDSGRVFVALDFDSNAEAEAIVDRLGDNARAYKIGLQLLTSAGPDLAARLAVQGKDVFLDLKLFEIPASVAAAVRAAGRVGASMVTVHAMAGPRIMAAAVEAATDFPRLKVIALTVVTSVTDDELARVGVAAKVDDQVVRLATLARAAGCDGVVASPREAAKIRAQLGHEPLIVTPGVRLASDGNADHARTAGPAEAFRAGATHIVLGRSITRAADPAAALASAFRVCFEVPRG
ncbi:orotidine-5'-phosphate decarboxylase [Fodinicola acaciae]|uniref:orotidine-5'-phosphate decarboxylase n=1 Tax=Fodinicola acaciae TaxID=2681555 RepID=UPI0013D0F327|nr:orotidine-5'-phosphate decarboxylase [Fodinicola acaciae]